MQFREYMTQDIRLSMLQLLADMPTRTANGTITTGMLQPFYPNLTRTFVMEQLGWLEKNGLVQLQHVESVTLAKITEKGLDVAADRLVVDGVKRSGD